MTAAKRLNIRERAEMIERVLRPDDFSLMPEEWTPSIRAARKRISRRYSALKRGHSFCTSAHLARVEWLTEFLAGFSP